MTPTPEPPTPQPSRRDDEWIAVFVAFATIGSILFWVLGRADRRPGFQDWSALFAPAIAPTPTASRPGVPAVSPPATTAAPLLPRLLGQQPAPVAPLAPESVAVSPVPAAIVPPVTRVAPAETRSTPGAEVLFVDVPPTHWAYREISGLAQRGIVAGFPDRTFRPNAPITRAEFAAIVREVFPPNLQRPTIAFKDIEPGFWAAADIDRAVQKGFMKGYPGQIFKPSQQIPRLEALVALSAGLNLQPPANPQQVLQQYSDAREVPTWAVNSIASASAVGLAVNQPERAQLLEPQRPATRADVAAMLYRAVTQVQPQPTAP